MNGLVLAVAVLAALATQDKKPDAVYTGRVLAPDGAPLPGAVVHPKDVDAQVQFFIDWPRPWRDVVKEPLTGACLWPYDERSATTAADGAFTLVGPPTERPGVLVLHPAFRARTVHGVAETGDVVLEPGASIDVRVLDESGRPIENAAVATQWGQPFEMEEGHHFDPEAHFLVVRAARTGRDGRALLDGIEPGATVLLAAIVSDALPPVECRVELPAAGKRVAVTLAATAARPLRVRVVDAETREPVAGARVLFARPASPPAESLAHEWAGEDGLAILEGVAAGTEVDVIATPPDVGPGFGDGPIPPFSPVVRARAGESIEIAVERAVPVRVRVSSAVDGRPLEGACVRLEPDEAGGAGVVRAPIEGRGDGLLDLDRVRPGSFRLSVWAPGFLPRRGVEVHVPPGGRPDGIEFALDPATWSLRGRVVSEADGTPVPGARVRLEVETGFRPPAVSTTETDESGLFSIDSVIGDPAKSVVTVAAPLFAVRSEATELVSGPSFREIRLAPGGRIEGRVVGPAGDPRPGAPVQIVEGARTLPSKGPNRTIVADSGGRFSVDHLVPGRYAVSAGAGPSIEVALGAGQVVAIDLLFPR